jgi:hypothetical protein
MIPYGTNKSSSVALLSKEVRLTPSFSDDAKPIFNLARLQILPSGRCFENYECEPLFWLETRRSHRG